VLHTHTAEAPQILTLTELAAMVEPELLVTQAAAQALKDPDAQAALAG
jgi:hypothetical protein